MDKIIGLVLIAAVVALVLWPRSDFVIRAGRSGVQLKGPIPKSKTGELQQFFQEEVAAAGPLKVAGRRTRDGRLRLGIRGRPVPGDQQRIRNFLQATL